MRRVPIRYGPRTGWAYLRDLRGLDEEAVDGTETDVAIELLDRLLLPVTGAAVGPGEAATLCAADRDRLLTAVHVRAIGARIAATPRCAGCGERFDLDFDLAALVDALDRGATAGWRQDDGSFATPGGLRFRLPTGAEELAAGGGDEPERALARRCRIDGDGDGDGAGELADAAELADAMEAVAPLVDLELDAHCPACGQHQPVRFDIQSYLLARLAGDHAARAREVHLIARAYGWGLAEILELPRARRATYVELIERQAAGR